MKSYKVSLSRGYVVSITAENSESAMRLAEYFVGAGTDDSEERERAEHNFSIKEIELTLNEATEVVKET